MGPGEVAVGLGDGAHADLIIGAGEESRECAHEGHGALTCGTANSHTHEILLRYETFNELLWSCITQIDREGGILCVAV